MASVVAENGLGVDEMVLLRRRWSARRVLPALVAASGVGVWGCSSPTAPAPGPSEADAAQEASGSDAVVANPIVEATVPCDVEGIESVTVPASYAKEASSRLKYRYRKFKSTRTDAPTIVVAPGGPGGDIMRQDAASKYPLGAISLDQFSVIYVDARGSGCNTYPALPESPEDVYTIENTARDLLAVVGNERLTNYFLYGASFGTAQVTVAASLLPAMRLPAPRRLVLEGVVGRAFDSFDAYFSAMSSEWLRTKAMLPTAWQEAFNTEPWTSKLKWSREQWGAFVTAQLILGDLPGQGPILKYWLDHVNEPYVASFMAAAATPATPSTLFRTIACRQLWGGWRTGREIRDGALAPTGVDICAGQPKVKAYDAKDWQTNIAITYFHGPFDPTTTTAQAEYHFDHLTKSKRQFVTVPAASHASLTLGLAARGCSASVWRALDNDPAGLKAALALCTSPGETAVALRESDALP